MPVIYTIGHSNQPAAALLDALTANRIELLVDVRSYPGSRRWPQFNVAPLKAALADAGVDYQHAPALGGRRPARPDSTNTGLRNESFRGYADYMQTSEFNIALAALMTTALDRRTAIMCAEALPWRCHRSLISDALVAAGWQVEHIFGGSTRPHSLTPAALFVDGRPSYPSLL